MNPFWSRRFWADTGERAIRTFAQTVAATVTIGATLTDIDWGDAVSIGAVAAIVSVAMSIGSGGFGTPGTASLITTPRPQPITPAHPGPRHARSDSDWLDWP